MVKKPLEKTKFSDLSKFTESSYKDSFKSAVATYVQFLSVYSVNIGISRDGVTSSINELISEVLDMIDFDK